MTHPDDENLYKNIPRIEAELNYYLEQKTKQLAFRCKANYYEEGSHCTRYFLNMEKKEFCKQNYVCYS